jgi:hypothetical protein
MCGQNAKFWMVSRRMILGLVLLWLAGKEFLSAKERVRWRRHVLPSDRCRSADFARQTLEVPRQHAQQLAADRRRTGSGQPGEARALQEQGTGAVRRWARRLAYGKRWVTAFGALSRRLHLLRLHNVVTGCTARVKAMSLQKAMSQCHFFQPQIPRRPRHRYKNRISYNIDNEIVYTVHSAIILV